MSIRLKCASCRTAFVTSDDQVGQVVACPKCNARQKIPTTVAVAEPEDPPAETSSVFVPADAAPRRGRWKRALLGLVVLLLAGGVGVLVAWPRIHAWLHPVPPDPADW